MREIKFRGQLLSKEWVYGNLSILHKKCNNVYPGYYISNRAGVPFAYDVRPETVGQFVGLKDEDGKEIYEGDIIRTYHSIGEVANNSGSFGIMLNPQDFLSLYDIWDRGDGHKVEIIGNIYENKELIQ